jgi:catechol 2,3-dioxygenase-like lactoylglutathione lyase family enzyme
LPKLVGINHVALEVADLEEALAFWESIFGRGVIRRRSADPWYWRGDDFCYLTVKC